MNWINGFELMCYGITAVLLGNIVHRRHWQELQLFSSAAIAGFLLELLAVRVTGIYHYSPLFYISIGHEPYQFPFFGGLMWGGLTVCSLRCTRKLNLNRLMTALCTGWLIVSMDMLLDIAAIRLDGGFWVWDGRDINLKITHHMFMSVIWVNFLGYLFETPAVVYLFLRQQDSAKRRSAGSTILTTLFISLAGIAFVGLSSALSLFLGSITDEWFACSAYLILWCYLLIRMLIALRDRRWDRDGTEKKERDLVSLLFWAAMYLYCFAALWQLGIFMSVPLYGVFALLPAGLTLYLCLLR